MQTDFNKFSSVANNERVLLLSRYLTNCSLTDLLELQSPMAEIQSETVSIVSFLNGAIQRPLSYEQHIMNQKLTCAIFFLRRAVYLHTEYIVIWS